MSQAKDDYVDAHLEDRLTAFVGSMSSADIRETVIFYHGRHVTFEDILRDEFEQKTREELEEEWELENKGEREP